MEHLRHLRRTLNSNSGKLFGDPSRQCGLDQQRSLGIQLLSAVYNLHTGMFLALKPVIETLHPLSAFFPCHHSMNSNAPKYGYGIDPSFKISPLPMPLPSTSSSPILAAVASVAKVFKFSVQPLP